MNEPTDGYEPLPPEVRLLRLAARQVRDGAALGPEIREALATWLDAEAAVRGEMKPFVGLLNAAIKHRSGVESYIRFGTDEAGQPAMHADTIEAAVAFAAAVTTDGATAPSAVDSWPSHDR